MLREMRSEVTPFSDWSGLQRPHLVDDCGNLINSQLTYNEPSTKLCANPATMLTHGQTATPITIYNRDKTA